MTCVAVPFLNDFMEYFNYATTKLFEENTWAKLMSYSLKGVWALLFEFAWQAIKLFLLYVSPIEVTGVFRT